MKIVVDSNIIFSALIKDSITRRLLFDLGDLIMPKIVFEEVAKYKSEIIKKSQFDLKELEVALKLITKNIEVIPDEIIKSYAKEAFDLIGKHSPEDIMFIACCLAFEGSILWSDDKKLKLQNKIKVFNTQEIIQILN